MRAGRHEQALSYDLRLPDAAQADALRLLDASRAVVNTTLERLWPLLDEFIPERPGPAWKHVVELLGSPDPHGDRQWRCEAETAGRILRAQAERKRIFQLIHPILSDSFIRPKTEKRPGGKQRQTIKGAIQVLQNTVDDDDTSFVLMQNVIEQACNHLLRTGTFPESYEEMQAIPLLSVGLLTYAGDDGGATGQAYRCAVNEENTRVSLRFRCPDATGHWHWREDTISIPLPLCVMIRLGEGVLLAPTLRELIKADGEHVVVLDLILRVPKTLLADWQEMDRVLGFDWGVHGLLTAVILATNPDDPTQPQQLSRPLFVQTTELEGHQARTRRQIDELKAKQATVTAGSPAWHQYQDELGRCWRLYTARNHQLAHFAANVLLVFAAVWGCALISGESLKTLKSTGRGKGVRGRWRNWRNNTTIRSEIWRILRYKSHLAGIHFRSEHPRGTSHTCPRCGEAAQTYRSSRVEHRGQAVNWGRWLICAACGYNADRDYCAALNLARVGLTYLQSKQTSGQDKAFSVTEVAFVKPCRYRPHGGGAAVSTADSSESPPPGGQTLLQWLAERLHASFIVSHPGHAMALWVAVDTKRVDGSSR